MWIQLLILGLIDGAGDGAIPPAPPAAADEGVGNWYERPKKRKRPMPIRYSDYASQEAFAEALRTKIIVPVSPLAVDAGEDDEIEEFGGMLMQWLNDDC